MFNIIQNKIYFIVIIIIIFIIAILYLGKYYIKKVARDELLKIYFLKKRKQKAINKMKKINKQELDINQIPYNEGVNDDVENQINKETNKDVENQSYIDPLGQNYKNNEIFMRDINDNTPNKRFQ